MSGVSKIPILHFITGLGAGGAEKVVLDLSSHHTNKFDVHIVSIGGRIEFLEKFHNNRIYPKVLFANKSIIGMLGVIRFVSSYVKEKNIKLIHAHLFHSVLIAGIIKLWNPNLKLVFTSHSINVESKFRELTLWFSKWLRNTDIIFSEDVKLFYIASNSVEIPNGINTNDYFNQNLEKFEKFTFLAIGRLNPLKNHKILVNAAAKLLSKFGEQFQVYIVGKGACEKELLEQIYETKTANVVKLLGFRSDIVELCNSSHAFVMPSKYEGFPISLLEAGASGLPCICTPVGSIPSLLNEENGFLVPEEEFSNCMEYVLNNREEAAKKGQKLRQAIIDSYDVRSIVTRHENLYLSLLNDQRA